MSVLGVFTLSSGYPPGEGCFASPALPCSFETLPVPLAAETQGSELTSKLKQTLNCGTDMFVCIFCATSSSVMRPVFSRLITFAADRLTSVGQNVKQHGQDCRCSKDSRTTETGGQHREDDGK